MKPKVTKEELTNLLGYDKEWEWRVHIPNDIFGTLTGSEEIMSFKAPHVAVLYSYIYLNTWLYRYAKYGRLDHAEELLDTRGIKGMLGLSPRSQEYNYAIKKGGVLEQLRLLETESWLLAPLDVQYEDVGDRKEPTFVYYNEYFGGTESDDNYKNRKIKTPVFAFEERIVKKGDDEYGYSGTFYDIENTHAVPFHVFIECMTNKDLGCKAFYVYAYLHSRCQMNRGLVEVSLEKISAVTGLRPDSRDKALQSLKKFGLVEVVVPADFYIGRPQGVETPANIYKTVTNDSEFTAEPKKYLKGKVKFAKDDENLATTADIDKQIEDLF